MCSSSQGCLCQCNNCNLPPTPLHPAHYPVFDRSKHRLLYKKAHETLQQDIRKSSVCKEEIFFPPCHLHQQNNTNADLKGRWFFKSLVTVKMQLITTPGHSISIQTSYKTVLRGPKFYLWPCPFIFLFC